MQEYAHARDSYAPLRLAGFIVLAAIVVGCAEMGAAMSQATQDMGGQCALYETRYAVYNNGDYMDMMYYSPNDSDGRRELNWVERTGQFYADRHQFGTFYETSPVTNSRYRFAVSCTRWH